MRQISYQFLENPLEGRNTMISHSLVPRGATLGLRRLAQV